MRSKQLRTSRQAVHTVGITEQGVLYIDVQRFAKCHSKDARTFYVRTRDVARIKHFASQGRKALLTDSQLIRLFAASFHSAEYALEWLRWAGIPTVRCHDEGACYNVEQGIPEEVLC